MFEFYQRKGYYLSAHNKCVETNWKTRNRKGSKQKKQTTQANTRKNRKQIW